MITKHMCSKILLGSASTFLAGAMAIAQAPTGSAPQQQQQQMPQQPPSANMGTADANSSSMQQNMSDQAFVSKALEARRCRGSTGATGTAEIAKQRCERFRAKMVQDHTQLGDQMKPIAQQLGVKEPKGLSKKDKQLMAKLQGLSGQQFDDAYIQTMVKDHKQDLKDFKEEADMTQNPNVKQAAQQGAQVISQHLELIQQIAQSHNVTADDKTKASATQ